jgi:hypothetical protein
LPVSRRTLKVIDKFRSASKLCSLDQVQDRVQE